jgi:hypothetical protein
MTETPFKMKGWSPFTKKEKVKKGDKASASNIIQADTDYSDLKKKAATFTGPDSRKRKLNLLTSRYGGTWGTEDRSGKGGSKTTFVNEKGQTVKQAETVYLDASKNVG